MNLSLLLYLAPSLQITLGCSRIRRMDGPYLISRMLAQKVGAPLAPAAGLPCPSRHFLDIPAFRSHSWSWLDQAKGRGWRAAAEFSPRNAFSGLFGKKYAIQIFSKSPRETSGRRAVPSCSVSVEKAETSRRPSCDRLRRPPSPASREKGRASPSLAKREKVAFASAKVG